MSADYLFWHIRRFFAYTGFMKVVGNERRPDWPKLGPSIIIATALIVAIRTAKWVAKSSADAQFQTWTLNWIRRSASRRGSAYG